VIENLSRSASRKLHLYLHSDLNLRWMESYVHAIVSIRRTKLGLKFEQNYSNPQDVKMELSLPSSFALRVNGICSNTIITA